MPTFQAAELKQFAENIFRTMSVPEDEARQVALSLVTANLCGHDSHGVIRIVQYTDAIRDGRMKPGAAFQVVKETAGVLVVDGNWGIGQVQAHRLLNRLIPRAQALGLAAGTLKNCGHIGRLGEYAEVAAQHKMAFISSVNNHGFGRGVAPPGGTDARIGTNPVCMGAPTKSDPVVLDIGTSVVAEGKVRVNFNKGLPSPEGWLLDPAGKPTTDSGVLYKEPRGTILPLGSPSQGYKGFGLGLLLDMFVGGFSGAPCSTPGAPNLSANAVFFLLLDISQFAGQEHFLSQVSGLAEAVRTTPRAEGVDEIMLPGDPERKSRKKREAEGVPLDEGTWKQLKELAQKLNVNPPAVH